MLDESEVGQTPQATSSSRAMQFVMLQKIIEIFKMFIAPGLVFFISAGLAAYCMYDASILRIIVLGVFCVFSLVFLIQRRRD